MSEVSGVSFPEVSGASFPDPKFEEPSLAFPTPSDVEARLDEAMHDPEADMNDPEYVARLQRLAVEKDMTDTTRANIVQNMVDALHHIESEI